jgi:hypothetical protein
MRIFSRLSLLGLFGLIFLIGCTIASNQAAGNNIKQQPLSSKLQMQRLIIKFRNVNFDPAQGDYLQKLSRDIKATLVYLRPMSGGAHVFSLENVSATTQLATIIQQLSKRPDILYVEQDRIMKHQQDK